MNQLENEFVGGPMTPIKSGFNFALPPVLVMLLLSGLITCVGYSTKPSYPILVLATDKDFGSYTAEILRAEGFNEFQIHSLADERVTLKYLNEFDVVILAETVITDKEVALFDSYVKGGGSLIAFKPDKKLSTIFGIVSHEGTTKDGYVLINTHSQTGRGLTSETLQFHGVADHYELKGGLAIATVYRTASASAEFPAIVMNDYGKGHAMAFLYNLPQSIAYTRQGNFQHASREMDGILGIRAMDLFTQGFVNTSKNTLNQADEQMRVLTHGIEQLSSFRKPLPRFWYFPDTLKCLVTLNNDGEDSKEIEFGAQYLDVNARAAKMTLYIKEVELISKAWVDAWIQKGFEMSGHPDDTKQAENPDWKTMDSVYRNLQDRLKSNYGVDAMKTITNHWFVWCGKDVDGALDFAAQAKIEEKNGIGLDCNYAHYDNGSDQGHFLGEMGKDQGNYTGSGLAMKFADTKGRVINVFQQLNNVYDQQYMEHKDQEGYFNCFRGLMDRSLDNEVYSLICVRAHNNEYYFSKEPLLKAIDYANSKGIPVWTELKLLEFLRMKEEATFTDIRWKGNQLSFEITSTLSHTHGLTTMIPVEYEGKHINKVSVNGVVQSYSVRSVKGFKYGMVTVKAGNTYHLTVDYINGR